MNKPRIFINSSLAMCLRESEKEKEWDGERAQITGKSVSSLRAELCLTKHVPSTFTKRQFCPYLMKG